MKHQYKLIFALKLRHIRPVCTSNFDLIYAEKRRILPYRTNFFFGIRNDNARRDVCSMASKHIADMYFGILHDMDTTGVFENRTQTYDVAHTNCRQETP